MEREEELRGGEAEVIEGRGGWGRGRGKEGSEGGDRCGRWEEELRGTALLHQRRKKKERKKMERRRTSIADVTYEWTGKKNIILFFSFLQIMI